MSSESPKPRKAIDNIWQHVYDKKFPKDGYGALDRAANHPETVVEECERAVATIRAYAAEHGLGHVLDDEGMPTTAEAVTEYRDQLVTADDTLDTAALDDIVGELYNYYQLVDDLASDR